MNNEHVASAIWFVLTLTAYGGARYLQLRSHRWWLGPAVIAAPLLVAATLVTHTSYETYLGFTELLILLLGPATVAFAAPVWEYRGALRRHWRVLAICVAAGSVVSLASGYALAALLDLPPLLADSFLPRSMTSPFAMPFAETIGGDAKLAALIVILVGIAGAVMGNLMLRLPIKSSLAIGLMLGISAHGVGTARAREIGVEQGAVAALAMILMGLFNIAGLAFLMLFSG